MNDASILALTGGVLIGLATSLLLLTKGRIFGISGIIGGLIRPIRGDILWRALILLGLITGGWLSTLLISDSSVILNETSSMSTSLRIVLAGLFVGFGTQMGGGCTSGHGVCGISRFSIRSVLATLLFISSGVITVYLTR